MCPERTSITVIAKDTCLPTTSSNRHHPAATCPITVAGVVSATHVSRHPTCDRSPKQQTWQGWSRGPRCWDHVWWGATWLASRGAGLKLEGESAGPGDKSPFPPDKDGPKMGMGFLCCGLWR
ncbi:unnamed protein product [Sphenostylis stenocarpa]|uniref:Uncharacterized protein n=1 Tax=Sphenostylis stenocarpa TaxID=92480 RepID=A0AA86SJN3_9FABA|nr:unnamed protein product [Sphenostylis stenocarpa]